MGFNSAFKGLKVPTIREEITKFSVKYRDEMTTQPNNLACTILEEEELRRLKKIQTNRFNNQIFVNIISQICEHMIGEYSLDYYYENNKQDATI